jgi:uncharacterized protein (TIGR02246 family)
MRKAGSAASDPAPVARRLAALLDAADHDGAVALLTPDCVYVLRGRTIHGREAIIASYDAAHADALATFDSIAYQSAVRADEVTPASAIIHFTDIITHGGVTHRHECEQRVAVGREGEARGLVVRIEHIDLAGQHEALNAFLAGAGLPARPALPA